MTFWSLTASKWWQMSAQSFSSILRQQRHTLRNRLRQLFFSMSTTSLGMSGLFSLPVAIAAQCLSFSMRLKRSSTMSNLVQRVISSSFSKRFSTRCSSQQSVSLWPSSISRKSWSTVAWKCGIAIGNLFSLLGSSWLLSSGRILSKTRLNF